MRGTMSPTILYKENYSAAKRGHTVGIWSAFQRFGGDPEDGM
jgi:hypothetical protein